MCSSGLETPTNMSKDFSAPSYSSLLPLCPIIISYTTGISDVDDSITAMYQAVSELPSANRDTLAYVILHLQR